MFSNSENIYEKELNLPLYKISTFAKYLLDYYLEKDSRRSYIESSFNEEICKSMLIPIALSNSKNLKYYFYILQKYNVKCTLDKLSDVSFDQLAKLRLQDNIIEIHNMDDHKKLYYNLLPNIYSEMEKEDQKSSIENKILLDGYKDLAQKYGISHNWQYKDGQYKIWMESFDSVRLYPAGLCHYEMALGIGYVYNILLNDPSMEDYFN